MNDEKSERILTVDVLRILAILGVILVHTTTRTFEVTGFHFIQTPVTLLLNIFARFCVPLFFLISGFVLEYRYKEGVPVKSFYKRRVERILAPYLFWSTAYFFFHIPTTPHTSVLIYLQSLLLGVSEYHLYFIPAIILFYCVFPVFHRYKSVLFRSHILSILFVLQLLIAGIDYYIFELPIYLPIRIFLLTYFFFIFGMFVSGHMERTKTILEKCRWYFFGFSFLTFIWVLLETIALFSKNRNIHFLYSQWRPSIYLYSVSLAAFVFSKSPKPKFESVIHFLSRNSFFVFFVHIFVLYGVWYLIAPFFSKLPMLFVNSGVFDLFLFGSVAGLSYVLTYIFTKIPRAGFFVGLEGKKRQ